MIASLREGWMKDKITEEDIAYAKKVLEEANALPFDPNYGVFVYPIQLKELLNA